MTEIDTNPTVEGNEHKEILANINQLSNIASHISLFLMGQLEDSLSKLIHLDTTFHIPFLVI